MIAMHCEAKPPAIGAAQAQVRAPLVLGFAATPAFAVMAIMSGLLGPGTMVFCGAAMPGDISLGGMAVMYGLMAVFHAAPWLGLLAYRQPVAGAREPA